MEFTLSISGLERLMHANAFDLPTSETVFLGFRGCLPRNLETHPALSEQPLETVELDYVHPRCTIVNWARGVQKFSVFPGSTAPNAAYAAPGGAAANQIVTGFFPKCYRKGVHKAGSSTAHEAFRQNTQVVYVRTFDDSDYDALDPVDRGTPWDNMHAAWCQSVNGKYSSAGCQVVVGYPDTLNGNTVAAGPWKAFKDSAYATPQLTFDYVLLNGFDARKAASSAPLALRLRLGSSGTWVTTLQQRLASGSPAYYQHEIDGKFGWYTHLAVRAFQKDAFGATDVDGIVGPVTATALGLANWPSF